MVPCGFNQFQLQVAGQQGIPDAQGDRRELDPYLVEQSRVGELPGEIAATDNPDVLASRGPDDLREYLRHVAAGVTHARAVGNDLLAVGEHPCRLSAFPGFGVVQQPWPCYSAEPLL